MTRLLAAGPRRSRSRSRTAYAAVLVGVLSLGLGGCSGDSLASQAKAGDRKGYVAGDGGIEQIPSDKRGEAVDLTGTTVGGKPWSRTKDAAGKVVVVNVWASWCSPCKAETPHLETVWKQEQKRARNVQLVGIDFREGAERGAATARAWGMTYPSLSDPSGTLILAFRGKAATTPATLVLDRQGRVAARINGPVTAPSTLTGLIDDVVAEKA